MRVHEIVVIDIESGAVEHERGFDYEGPLALCDRSAQANAQNTYNAASSITAPAMQTNQSALSTLVPSLQQMATNPQGYGANAVNTMANQAEGAAAAEANKNSEDLSLRAMRSGNVAGLTADETAGTLQASQATQGALQDILSENARLKAQQQEGALQGLGNVAENEGNLGIASLAQQTNATNANVNAGKSGWFQNLLGGLDTGAQGLNAYANYVKARNG